MFTKLSLWFSDFSTGSLTLACLSLFLIFSVLILPDQNAKAAAYSGEVGTPDTSLYYSAADLYNMADKYEPQGRAAYIRARFTFDIVWPLVYLAFLVTGISWLAKKANLDRYAWSKLNLLPFVGVFFDYLENGSATLVMSRYPQATPILDSLAGKFTFLKWAFLVTSVVVMLIFVNFVLVRLIQSHKQRA